ncbi:MAG: hypothetical protein ACTSVY_04470 [Candidatus Helarchaeota archaeon]
MVNLQKFLENLYINVGIFGFIIGSFSLIFGAFNIPMLPKYFESQSGNPDFDGSYTLYINAILWLMLCAFLIYFGMRFFLLGNDIKKITNAHQMKKSFQFHLIGASIITGLMAYITLLILNVIRPAQFFPHVLFAGTEDLMDYSLFFNALLFYFLIEILHRIGGNFIKFGMKLEEIK